MVQDLSLLRSSDVEKNQEQRTIVYACISASAFASRVASDGTRPGPLDSLALSPVSTCIVMAQALSLVRVAQLRWRERSAPCGARRASGNICPTDSARAARRASWLRDRHRTLQCSRVRAAHDDD